MREGEMTLIGWYFCWTCKTDHNYHCEGRKKS